MIAAYRRLGRRLRGDTRGLAMIEFAMILPVLLILIMYMLELANYALVRQQVSQLALLVVDNGSRIGAQSVARNKPITEGDINDVLTGAALQAGGLDIGRRGRIILTSLEVNAAKTGQWLHWQRCTGALAHPSSYGSQGDGATGSSVTGMGPPNGRVAAITGVPAMFVEIGYRYRPLISAAWAPSSDIVETAAMLVRDDRDTSQVYPSIGETASTCT
ncbi:TadE family protein [Sphingomonas sp. 1P06PA]|uniref:TadE family protein n=1 Tax=Sphingomonas sp. 1P06PA TaxID=554121 RepID=UPI0039A573FA